MLIVVGWGATAYGGRARQNLGGILAGLCAESVLTTCLAVLPKQHDERRWLLSLLSSLRRAAAVRSGVLLSASTMVPADLAACEAAGLDEAVVVQDCTDPASAIDAVRAHQQARPEGSISIRVWFDEAAHPGLYRHVCAWKRATSTLRLEPVPFPWRNSRVSTAPTIGGARDLACEWLRSAFTLTASGTLVPCPYHKPKDEPGSQPQSIVELMAQRQAWLQTLGSSPICRSCDRLPRFAGSGLILAQGPERHAIIACDGWTGYYDHIRCDAATLTQAERDAALAALVDRLRA